MPKLNLKERRLLKYPPTPRTWVCMKKVEKVKGAQTETCYYVNSGPRTTCMLCGNKRPSKPVLLWPEYVAACEKAGVRLQGVE